MVANSLTFTAGMMRLVCGMNRLVHGDGALVAGKANAFLRPYSRVATRTAPGVVHSHQIFHGKVVRGKPPGECNVWGWDGNETQPTLHGSIMVESIWGEQRQRVFWHGHFTAGRFEACE